MTLLAFAALLSTLHPLAHPATRQVPGCAGALAAAEYLVKTDHDADGDHVGLVVFPRAWDDSGDAGPSCALGDLVVVREYELLGCRDLGGGKAAVKVRYRRLASVAHGEFVAERPRNETVALPLVRRRGAWWIARPQPPRVSLPALAACYRSELAALDEVWWQQASSAQRNHAEARKRTLERLAALPRE